MTRHDFFFDGTNAVLDSSNLIHAYSWYVEEHNSLVMNNHQCHNILIHPQPINHQGTYHPSPRTHGTQKPPRKSHTHFPPVTLDTPSLSVWKYLHSAPFPRTKSTKNSPIPPFPGGIPKYCLGQHGTRKRPAQTLTVFPRASRPSTRPRRSTSRLDCDIY